MILLNVFRVRHLALAIVKNENWSLVVLAKRALSHPYFADYTPQWSCFGTGTSFLLNSHHHPFDEYGSICSVSMYSFFSRCGFILSILSFRSLKPVQNQSQHHHHHRRLIVFLLCFWPSIMISLDNNTCIQTISSFNYFNHSSFLFRVSFACFCSLLLVFSFLVPVRFSYHQNAVIIDWKHYAVVLILSARLFFHTLVHPSMFICTVCLFIHASIHSSVW